MNAFAEMSKQSSGPARPWRREARAMLSLAVPLVLTELAFMAILTTDVVLMGWLGPEALAAGTLAFHFYEFFAMFAVGLLGAVAPILSQHLGARRFRMVRRGVRQGLWMAVIIAVPFVAVMWQAGSILVLLGQDPDLSAAGEAYLRIVILGFLPTLWYVVLSLFLAAHGRPRATLVVTLLGILVNGLADYTLMFGNFGFPRMGLLGAGVASATVGTFMFLGLMTFVLTDWKLRRYRILGRFWRADWSQLFEIARIGLPIAVASLAEVGMFVAAVLLMGLLGTNELAAHAVAVQCAAIAFMVPLGIGQAATVRVGRAVGAGDNPGMVRAGWTAMALAICIAVLPAAAFWFLGDAIVGLFLDRALAENGATISIAVSFLAIAALFQFADSLQVTALGALRGLKDTRVPMLIALAGYWGLGLTSAAFFGVYLDFGGQAIWIALAVGLSVVAVLLVRRFRVQSLRAQVRN